MEEYNEGFGYYAVVGYIMITFPLGFLMFLERGMGLQPVTWFIVGDFIL